MANITIFKGNPYNATITIVDEDSVAYDITGMTVFFTVKKLTDNTSVDTAALITKDITTHSDAANGVTTLSLTAIQTNIAVGDYKWDLRVYELATLTQVNTASGTCTVTDVVTKRTS